MKNITATILTLAMLASMTACGGNNGTPANTTATTTVGDDAHIVPPETTETTTTVTEETTAPVEVPFDVDAFLADATVYEVTTGSVMYTMNAEDSDNSYEVEKKEYHIPFVKFEERREKGEQFSEKIALRFTDLNNLTILVDMYTSETGFYQEITNIITTNYAVACSEPLEYSERSFSVVVSDDIVVLPGNYQTDTYLISETGYINIPTVRDEGNSKSKINVFVYENTLRYNYINTLFSNIVSLGGELTDMYNSEDDLYAEYGKVLLKDGVPCLEMTSKTTIGEWYQSENFPYAKIRDKYGFATLKDMANRFKSTEGYQEFIKIYEELEELK